MGRHAVFGFYIALGLLLGTLANSQTALAQDNEPIPDNQNADVVAQIEECAAQGKETVLFADEVECVKYLSGVRRLDARNEKKNLPEMPLQVDASQACHSQSDKRVLPARAIKNIVNDITKKIDPKGIRVIGAVFCDDLDLVGLDLQYSLVLDHSIFAQGIDARDFRSKGDLSFDGALLFGELRVTRAHIAGTIFGSDTMIDKAEILDSEITGSVLFRRSLLLEPAIIDTARISGELSLRQSAFPYFLLQFATVGGVLDLTGSQARCSYQVRTSKIGDLVLDGAGFGLASSADDTAATLFDWKDQKDLSNLFRVAGVNRAARRLLSQDTSSSMNATDTLDDRWCRYGLIAAPSVLVVSDTTIDAQLCLRDVNWLSTPIDQADGFAADSFVTLNDVTVGATAFIDLTSNTAGAAAAAGNHGKRQFEILGLKAQTLVLNFGNATHPQSHTSLYVNGLGFLQVYAADEKPTQCGYNPGFAQPDGNKPIIARLINSVGNLAKRRRPTVEEIMPWLNANTAQTTQPFSAFVDVFQKNGEISAARALQIRKADAELSSKIARLFNWTTSNSQDTAQLGGMSSLGKVVAQSAWNLMYGIWTFVTGLVGVAFGAILWLLADNGYRPEKVGWFVGLILLLSFLYFWFCENVIAIRPEKKSEPPGDLTPSPEKKDLPVGLTFLFDRLLPAYQIREDHYKIAAFLKRVPEGQGKELRYFRMRFYVAPTDDATTQRVERALDIIKFLGLVLAVFLVAALNALVSH